MRTQFAATLLLASAGSVVAQVDMAVFKAAGCDDSVLACMQPRIGAEALADKDAMKAVCEESKRVVACLETCKKIQTEMKAPLEKLRDDVCAAETQEDLIAAVTTAMKSAPAPVPVPVPAPESVSTSAPVSSAEYSSATQTSANPVATSVQTPHTNVTTSISDKSSDTPELTDTSSASTMFVHGLSLFAIFGAAAYLL